MLGADVLVLELGGEFERLVEGPGQLLTHRRLVPGLPGHLGQPREPLVELRAEAAHVDPELAQETLGDPLWLREQGLEEMEGRDFGMSRGLGKADRFLQRLLTLDRQTIPSHRLDSSLDYRRWNPRPLSLPAHGGADKTRGAGCQETGGSSPRSSQGHNQTRPTASMRAWAAIEGRRLPVASTGSASSRAMVAARAAPSVP